ncbi:hypothetical protein [Arthrobacter sp. 9V]|uniref:hypothetical protein n=1 Tax=Arthrobacter sp. 9V TaxID=2653132 RepID=UPI00135C05B9|nr:hypothetical protein [Arthrobacter sp. 9V]
MSYNAQEPEFSAAFSITGCVLFPSPVLPLALEVLASEEPQSKDEKLNRAICRLIPAALERKQGILIIQSDYGKYTVRVDPEVPCGTTRESPYRHEAAGSEEVPFN